MTSTLPFSLGALRSHAIFVPPGSDSKSDDDWELVDNVPLEKGDAPAAKCSRIVLQDKNLLVAFGKEIRITCITGDGWEIRGPDIGTYKTLSSPHLTFQIQHLIPNPTGRLLAVVGHHQMVILVLPRAGLVGSARGNISCRGFPVDEFQHSPSSIDVITKVRWHPWGYDGNSLWVLTANGKLCEYDVLRPHDPIQTFNFLPERSTASSSRFSAIDPLSQYAVSFTFSQGSIDFAPLMTYALMANGDIFVMGPVIPFHAEVPSRYLRSLKSWTTARSQRLLLGGDEVFQGVKVKQGSAEHAAMMGRVGVQAQWVDTVISQARNPDENRKDHSSTFIQSDGLSNALEPGLSAQRATHGLALIHPPHLTESGGPAPGSHRPLMRQGPVLFCPPPHDISNGDSLEEQFASDIILLHTNVARDDQAESPGAYVNVVAIVWSGGRVDIGVELDSPEPRWMTSRDPSPADVELAILESISFPYHSSSEIEAQELNAPSIITDPVHSDVFYIQHSFGVDAVSVAPWVRLMCEEGDDLPPSDVAHLVESASSSQVIIIGSASFCSLSLGYGLLALASTGQLAVVEMDFRVLEKDGRSLINPVDAISTGKVASGDTYNIIPPPFNYDIVLDSLRGSFDSRASLRLSNVTGPLQSISPEHVRSVAEASAQVHSRIEAIRCASLQIERHLDTLMANYVRQVQVLSDSAKLVEDIDKRVKSNAERAHLMASEQARLGERLDGVLNHMIGEHRPQIGDVERKWFDELERIRQRVHGVSNVRRAQSFSHRSEVLRDQLEVVRPLTETPLQDPLNLESSGTVYGHKQLRTLHTALSDRSTELARLMRKIDLLYGKVEATYPEEGNK